jgi:hypothetical protein
MTVQPEREADYRARKWTLFIVYFGCVATVLASHHISALALVALVYLLALFRLLSPLVLPTVLSAPGVGRAGALSATFAAVAAVALVLGWVAFAVPQTPEYLSPSVSGLADGLASALSQVGGTASATITASSQVERLISYAMTCVIAIAVPFGVWRVARERRSSLAVLLAVLAFSYFALVAVRLVASDGAELAGRAFTYVYVPVSFVLALVIAPSRWRRLSRWASSTLAAAFLAILLLGGLVGGWPPSWERLPAGYQISGLERSISTPDLAVAEWFGQNLPPGGRTAVDLVDYALIGTIGQQDVIRNGGPLFYATEFRTTDRDFVQASNVRYVVVDRRLALGEPASGRYFPDDPTGPDRVRPMPEASLEKFNRIAGISRIYDNGDIRVFDLLESPYRP